MPVPETCPKRIVIALLGAQPGRFTISSSTAEISGVVTSAPSVAQGEGPISFSK